jgi:formyltetrahydrofolate deformylase
MKAAVPPKAILLLSCSDVRGIVAEVSHFIFIHNGNILHSDQHSDPETGTFFMRVEWDISGFTIEEENIAEAFTPVAEKFSMDWRIEFSARTPRIAVFVSKLDHCLYDILLRTKEGELKGEIAVIISNHADLAPLAEYFGIPFYVFPVDGASKEETEAREIAVLSAAKTDLIILARYMQVLSAGFVSAFKNRIINIHHSFLPAFVGAKPYHQAFERGVKIIGATSHYVTPELDQGPIIEQDVTRISHSDDVSAIMQKGKNLEKLVLSRAVRLHLEHRILVFGNKTIVFG